MVADLSFIIFLELAPLSPEPFNSPSGCSYHRNEFFQPIGWAEARKIDKTITEGICHKNNCRATTLVTFLAVLFTV
jgi:hypothetical protein